MAEIPLNHALILCGTLFSLGLLGLLLRRTLIFMLMSLEIMLNSTAVAFVAVGSRWQQPDGQIMFVLILTLAAAEVAVALGLVMQIHQRFKTLNVEALSTMKG